MVWMMVVLWYGGMLVWYGGMEWMIGDGWMDR